MSDTFDSAKWYVTNHGLRVFPVHGFIGSSCSCGNPQCANPGKHPATIQGLKNATSDIGALETMFGYDPVSKQCRKSYYNIAIATGPDSGVFVVDVDGVEGESALLELENKHGPLPKTLTATTGRGRHIYFKYPEGRKVYSRVSKLGTHLDVRGAGGYVVAPPSKHHSGVRYQWLEFPAPLAEAPQWLLDLVCDANAPVRAIAPPTEVYIDTDREWSLDEIREMLSYIPPSCSRDEWLRVGMALNDGGYPMAVWDEWSRGAPEKYNGFDVVRDWKSFKAGGGVTMGTLVHTAQAFGWKPIIDQEPIDYANHPAREFLISIGALSGPVVEVKTPHDIVVPDSVALTHPLKLPGLIGDTVRAIVGLSRQPQPELAMLNTIAALGAVFGRRYAMEASQGFDTRTNLYAVGIAPTGSGKDISRKIIKAIFRDAGLEQFLGSDKIISEAGMRREVSEAPACLMMIDEFGMVIDGFYGSKAASHLKGVVPLLCELYSTSNSVSKGGKYADAKTEQIVLNNPNLCLYGTTTLESYRRAMKKESVLNGDLNRFIILPVTEDYPDYKEPEIMKIPESLISAWGELSPDYIAVESSSPVARAATSGADLSGLNLNMIAPETTKVRIGQCDLRIKAMLKRQRDNLIAHQETTGALWVRYVENCMKIAMIFAITRNRIAPTLTESDLDIAEGIVTTSVRYASELAMNHMFENEYDRSRQEILGVIKASGSPGIGRSRVLGIMKHIPPKEFDVMISALVETNMIEAERQPTGKPGRPSIIYRAVGCL